MAKIARRSEASNPSSLTSVTVPPTNFIENNLNYTIPIRQQKRSTYSKSEINVQDSISPTTPLLYSSSLSESSESSSESLSSTPLTDVETTEKLPLPTLPQITATESIETETTPTTILTSIDPLRSTGYQLTTRTISKNFDNNIGKQPHHHGSASIHPNTQKSNNHNIKNISNVSNTSQNETTKTFSTVSASSIPATPASPLFDVDKTSGPLSTIPLSTAKSPAALAAERERVRIEFYATYDVMTGVRIAATLGGFFSLMVFLIVWKSRSHSNETIKALKDPKTAALTVACMQEEEDRKIIEAMDATGLSIFPDEYDTMLFRRQRMLSVGNVSAPPVLHRGFRFSSVGGYSSLLEPPRRFSISSTGGGMSAGRRRSASESSRILTNYPMGNSFGTDDYFVETDDELEEDCDNLNQTGQKLLQNQGFLEVPPSTHQDTRRSSAMTCCSTESSYLERRCSALTLGINNLPPELRQKDESTKKPRRGSSTDTWDYYYPDIQVIQATPKSSPLASDKDFEKGTTFKQARTISQDTTTTAASGISSITLDSSGSSWQKNSMICFYDPESLQERRLPSIDSEHSLDFCQSNTTEGEDDSSDKLERGTRLLRHQVRQPTIITTTSATPSPKTLTDKFDDMRGLKLRKLSDASSCLNNNTSFSYYVSNTNNLFDHSGSCITPGITQPPSSTYSVSRAVRSNLRGVGTIGGTGIGRAPLASCSSFKMSSVECQDSDLRSSLGDDESVFIESYADTDDDLEQFSTDSDEISLDIIQANQSEGIRYIDDNSLMPTLPISNKLQPTSDSYNLSSFYEHQISAKSAPPEILNGKRSENYKKPVGKGALLKQSHQRTSIESHRTLSVSSSDKILLVPKTKPLVSYEQCVGKKFKTKSSTDSPHIDAQYNNKHSSSMTDQHQNQQNLHLYPQQEELLLKPILSPGNTPLLSIKRSHFQQQCSDPSHSLPTTDETVTFDTCSTEIPVVTTIVTTNLTGTSTTTSVFSPAASHFGIQNPENKKYYYDQHKQKPPIIIKKQSSFSYDNNNDSSISSNSNSNSINRNLSKKRLSSSKLTNKKIKIKNRTALSDSSIPPYLPQVPVIKPPLTTRTSEVLIPQSLQAHQSDIKIISDDLLIKTIKAQSIDCRKTDFCDYVNLPYGQDNVDPFHTSVSYSSSKNLIDDREISLVESASKQQKNQFIENSSCNLLKHRDKFNNYSSASIPILNPNISKNVDNIMKTQIVDVSIVIEGVESEDSSTNKIDNMKPNIVTDNSKKLILDNSKTITSTTVMLELPVIKIPTDIEDDDSNSSNSRSVGDSNEFNNKVGRVRSKSERCDPPIRDPSLPGTSRKWSKETLF